MKATNSTSPITEYLAIVNDLHGAYLDSYTGFLTLVDEYDKAVTEMRRLRPSIPLDAFADTLFSYRKQPENDGIPIRHLPASEVIHECTQGQYRARNAELGRNHIVIGQMFVAMVYNYWEDTYRQKIATAYHLPSKDYIKLDFFNDLRLLRNAITHRQGLATKETECQCKVLKWFRENDQIVIDPQKAEQVVIQAKTTLTAFTPPAIDPGTHWESELVKLAARSVEATKVLERHVKGRPT